MPVPLFDVIYAVKTPISMFVSDDRSTAGIAGHENDTGYSCALLQGYDSYVTA